MLGSICALVLGCSSGESSSACYIQRQTKSTIHGTKVYANKDHNFSIFVSSSILVKNETIEENRHYNGEIYNSMFAQSTPRNPAFTSHNLLLDPNMCHHLHLKP